MALCRSAPGQLLPPAARTSSSAMAPPASNIFPTALCHSVAILFAMAPRPATNLILRRRSPVWLAIWRTWAGFANSQHRDAAFATPDKICAHSSLLPHWAAAQTDANLSAHLHRLPTPPPYLRQMRLLHGRGAGIRCWMRLPPGWGAGIRCWMRLSPGCGAGISCWMWLPPDRVQVLDAR